MHEGARYNYGMQRPREIGWLVGIALFACTAIALYWLCWFAFPAAVQSRLPGDADYAIYAAYELAFLLPDGALALACLLAAGGIWRQRTWAYCTFWLAAGGILFLGLEDLLYDLQHSMFYPFSAGSLVELLIVLLILSLGPLTIRLLWRVRHWFMSTPPPPG